MTMRWPQIQRTERTPLVVPTPRIEPVMAWVVEIGMPPIGGADDRGGGGGFGAEAADGLQAGDARAHGFDDSPAAEHRAQRDRGVTGEDDPPARRVWSWPKSSVVVAVRVGRPSPAWPAAVSSRTMMPMVFCASLPPWPRL